MVSQFDDSNQERLIPTYERSGRTWS